MSFVGRLWPTAGQNYDLVSNNCRVMDPETNHDDIANVGITGVAVLGIAVENHGPCAAELGLGA